jgi:uncharacterized protein (DUF2141 family)
MQTILHTVVLFFSVLALQAQNTIEISMINFRTDDGTVKIGLYNEEAEFLNIEYKTATSDISEKRASTTFTDIPDGVYAISCYHDENGNEEFDMYLGMIPKEPYACSNDAKGMFGPPKWEVAKFEVVNGETKELIITF